MIRTTSLMTRQLVTVPHTATVMDAASLMRERRIGSVFVERHGDIVGIVTEADIVRRAVAIGHMPGFMAVAAIMSSPVIGIEGHRPITEAADLMERHQTRHLAVLDHGMIVGVLSVRDLLHPVSIDEF